METSKNNWLVKPSGLSLLGLTSVVRSELTAKVLVPTTDQQQINNR